MDVSDQLQVPNGFSLFHLGWLFITLPRSGGSKSKAGCCGSGFVVLLSFDATAGIVPQK
jgi:hypothetical protein